MLKKLTLTAAVAATVALVGCGGGGGGDNSAAARPPGITTVDLKTLVSVPGITSATVYSFDLAQIDPATSKYYITDRDNKGVDVVDLTTNLVTQFIPPATLAVGAPGGTVAAQMAGCRTAAFAPVSGCASGVSNDNSGPDGLDLVPAIAAATAGTNVPTIFVGDVNALWVLNRATGAVIQKVNIGGASNLRADEGCFDPVDNIYAISSPGESPPFVTFIDALNLNVLATVFMNELPGNGLEACVFDAATNKFYFNNDGGAVNPRGEVDGINTAVFTPAIRAAATFQWPGVKWLAPGAPAAGQPAIAGAVAIPAAAAFSQYALGNCDPTGITLGPSPELGVMCRQGNVGETLTFLILDKTTGAKLATLNAGGGDQITFSASSNAYYLADSRWTATGKSCGAGSAACPLTPSLAVVNATTRGIFMTTSGNNSHSIAAGVGKGVSAFTTATATGGGASFGQSLVPVPVAAANGGIAIFQ